MADKTNVQKDIESTSWMVALASDRDSPQDLFHKSQLRQMKEYVAGNWSYIPQELQELWETPDNVKSGKVLNLTSSQISTAETSAKDFYTTKIESVRKTKQKREELEKKLVEEKKKKEEEDKKVEEKKSSTVEEKKNTNWFTRT